MSAFAITAPVKIINVTSSNPFILSSQIIVLKCLSKRMTIRATSKQATPKFELSH